MITKTYHHYREMVTYSDECNEELHDERLYDSEFCDCCCHYDKEGEEEATVK
jgi:hypothetical protein